MDQASEIRQLRREVDAMRRILANRPVRLPIPTPQTTAYMLFLVSLVWTGGDNGNDLGTTGPSYDYQATDLRTGNVFSGTYQPGPAGDGSTRASAIGKASPAIYGIGYIDDLNVFHLLYAFEVWDSIECGTGGG